MSTLKIPFDGKTVPFFREEGTLDVMLVPNVEGEHNKVMIDLGFDFELFQSTIEMASILFSRNISNNLQV